MRSSAKRFNTFDGTSHFAGPRPGPSVPNAPQSQNMHYDISQIVPETQLALIKSSQKMVFQTLGDTGNDDEHNGGVSKRQAVADAMEKECIDTTGTPEEPSFCYHLGDVIYPGGDGAKYEEEFYQPYKGYGNAIVAIPGNHDYYGDQLASFKENFIQPSMSAASGGRPAMNLPWYYWVMDTPVATIIGLGVVSNYVSDEQRHWFEREMIAADPKKALIVATHYPPFCFDGSDNSAARFCIDRGIAHSKRTPDLVIAGHSHTYQRIESAKYPVLVVGTGGVGTSRINKNAGNGAKLMASSDSDYGALTLSVDANSKTIHGNFNVAATKSGADVPKTAFDTFSYPFKS